MNDFAPQSLHPPPLYYRGVPRGWERMQINPEDSRLPRHLPNLDSEYWEIALLDGDIHLGLRLYDFQIDYLYNVTNGFQSPNTEGIIRDILRLGPNATMGDGISIRDYLVEMYNYMHDATTVQGTWRDRDNNNQTPEITTRTRTAMIGGKRRRKTKRKRNKRKKTKRHR